MVVNLRNRLAILRRRWSNFRRSMQVYLSYDYEQSLDLITLGAGIRSVNYTERWKRRFLALYRLLGFYQFAMSLIRVGFSIQNPDDLVGFVAAIAIAMCMTVAFVKLCIMEHYKEAIQQSKAFICSNTAHSSDPDHDASIRQGTTRTAVKVILTIFIMLCCDQVMLWIPNATRDRILIIPKQFQVLGPMAAGLLQGAYNSTCFVFWGCRYYCTTLTIMSIVNGLRSELMIVTRGFETIDDHVQAQVLDDQSIMTGTSRKLPSSNALQWKHLKRILGDTVEQHVEVLRNMQQMKLVVSWIYTIIHYNTMIAVSMIVLLVIRSEVSLISIVLVLTSCILILECYLWCQQTDSFQDTMEKIADTAGELCFRLEHSVDNHSVYIQTRRSLMIVQLNASQAKWFSCGSFFPISVESFGNLCMIIYRFATFLMDLD